VNSKAAVGPTSCGQVMVKAQDILLSMFRKEIYTQGFLPYSWSIYIGNSLTYPEFWPLDAAGTVTSFQTTIFKLFLLNMLNVF
jgi:hypothetical protein